MNIRAKFEAVRLPKVLAELKFANQFLKVLSVCFFVLAFVAVALALVLVTRGPSIIALAPSGAILGVDGEPNAEKEVETALRKYISLRYSWDAKSVKDKLALARTFVHPNALRSFDSDLAEVQKFAIDRNVAQRGYAADVIIDLPRQVARVRGDRVTTIQGLTAAGPLNLTLQFESGPRTKLNPWGIYVSREKNELDRQSSF
jgi:hypothetical protein